MKISAGSIAAAFTIFFKGTKIIAAIKLLKFTKPLITAGSMLVSVFLYGITLGPWFAIGLMAMLFIHEMGHVIALRRKGFESPGPVFIPFLGAAIFLPKVGSRETEAYIGIGGPILGTVGAVLCYGLWWVTGRQSEILLLASFIGLYINLFNLIPLSPLDGGRITQVAGTWFKYLGVAIVMGFTVYLRRPDLLLIWILCLDSFRFPRWVRPGLAGFLWVMMVSFMILGYVDPIESNVYLTHWWVVLIDAGVGAIWVWLFWAQDLSYKEIQIGDTRPLPSWPVRGRWLAAWIVLTLFLVGMIMSQVASLPEGVK